MNWADKFKKQYLKQGIELHYEIDDKMISVKNGVYKFTFRGANKYQRNIETIVDASNPKNMGWHCTCWDFITSRNCCVHTAAAIYKVEDMLNLSAAVELDPPDFNSELLYLFNESESQQEYQYYDVRKFFGCVSIYKSQYDILCGWLDNSYIKISRFTEKEGYDSYGTPVKFVDAEVKINIPDKTEITVKTTFDRDYVRTISCDGERCYYEYKKDDYYYEPPAPCVHAVAAFIAIDRFIKRVNPGDATDVRANRLLAGFRRQSSGNYFGSSGLNINLEMEITNNVGNLFVSFRIGTDKLYKVKHITEMVNKVDESGTLKLGKNSAINFALSSFSPNAQIIYDFIHRQVQDNENLKHRSTVTNMWGYSRTAIESIVGSIFLEGSVIDEVYDIMCETGETAYTKKCYDGSSVKGKLRTGVGKPDIHLTLKEYSEHKRFAGVTVQGPLPDMIKGVKSIYYIEGNCLYKVLDECYSSLLLLLDAANWEEKIRFTIGKRSLSEFYYSVLPELSKIAEIDDKVNLENSKYMPPRAEITFYLDNVDGIVSCESRVNYGEMEHFATDSLKVQAFSESYRDYHKESTAIEMVKRFFPVEDIKNNQCICDDDEGIYEIYRNGVDELLKIGEIQCTDRFHSRSIKSSRGVKVGVSVESDLLNLDIKSGDIPRDELAAIISSYKLKRKFHKLKNGDFLDLTENGELTSLVKLLETCHVSPKEILQDKLTLPLYRAIYLDKLLEGKEDMYSHRDRNFKRLIKDFGTVKDSDYEVPLSLSDTLRGYQVYGFKWLNTLSANGFGGILADDMGLGKTLQTITLLLSDKENREQNDSEGKGHTSLIVCPASLVYNWQAEIERFAPALTCGTLTGTAKERRAMIEDKDSYDVFVTSYDLLKRDVSEYENMNFDCCILDEAQFIKNPKTAAAKSVKVIKAAKRLALTGTPIENRLSELWSIFDFLMPGFLYEYETFRREFETPIAKNKDADASERLKKMVSSFILRRLKGDVLRDLPEKIEEVRYAVMESEQRKLYDSQVLQISKKLKDESDAEFKKRKIELLAELTRTRQICCDPHLLFDDYKGESAKREACMELIESAIEGEHRMLVFSQFTSMLALLEMSLKQRNIEYYKITGETSKEERMRLVKSFNEGTVPVFLISLKAGGTGLNLTGADIVIHYDPWWNLAVQNQATDRAHRIGQTKKVAVYKLIIKDSIEEKIIKLQESKKDLADQILNGENGNLSSLSKEDLLELLG